jgi:hypothetical protein
MPNEVIPVCTRRLVPESTISHTVCESEVCTEETEQAHSQRSNPLNLHNDQVDLVLQDQRAGIVAL